MHFLCLCRCRCPSGTDCPYWFVSDDESGNGFCILPLEGTAHLAGNDCERFSTFTFFERFTDADDGNECIATGGLNFLGNLLVGFTEILPPFGVTNNNIATA